MATDPGMVQFGQQAARRIEEIPKLLPVKHLSKSSMELFIKCPEKWRRRYLLGQYEPSGGPLLLGSTVGAAELSSFQNVITEGEALSTEDVLDTFSKGWDHEVEKATNKAGIDWGGDKPGNVKDKGVAVIKSYHTKVAPTVSRPVSVERKVTLRIPEAKWGFIGYLDMEAYVGSEPKPDEQSMVIDLKVKGSALTQTAADSDLQPSSYLAARRAEGNPALGFDFHAMRTDLVKSRTDLVSTQRTDFQLDMFLVRMVEVAREIAWRTEFDMWAGAVPGTWWCSERYCGFWHTCRYGGRRA